MGSGGWLFGCPPDELDQPTGVRNMTTRDAYIEKMKTQLDDLNVRMESLSNKAAEAQANVRATYDKDMAQLREQSVQAKAKMEELKSAGEDRWDAMVTEMEKVRDAFVHSFSYFKSQV
jgi:TolA-binding protein